MGNCISGNNRDKSKPKPVDPKDIEIERRKNRVTNILLLGAGESGKTTFMKQLIIAYGGGFDLQYQREYRKYALMNVIEGAYYIVKGGQKNPDLRIKDPKAQLAAKTVLDFFVQNSGTATDQNGEQRVTRPNGIENLPAEVAEAIITLNHDPQFQKTMDQPNLQVQDGWRFLSERIENYPTWGGEDWLPSDEDLLHLRVRTAGVNSRRFKVNDLNINVTDVGGQKAERQKWANLFRDVSALCYLQSLGEYDQMMFEDDEVPRLKDSLDLWKKTINDKRFTQSTVIVIFNKVDVLRRKYIELQLPFPKDAGTAERPVPVFDPNMNAEENINAVTLWFKKIFQDLAPADKDFYAHDTTAIHTPVMKVLVDLVILNITEQQMKLVGL